MMGWNVLWSVFSFLLAALITGWIAQYRIFCEDEHTTQSLAQDSGAIMHELIDSALQLKYTIEAENAKSLKTDLGLTGTNSGDQTIILAGDVTCQWEEVRVATTKHIELFGYQPIDGVHLAAGRRPDVLVKCQNNRLDNGVYVSTEGRWIKRKISPNALIHVRNGMCYADTRWIMNMNNGIATMLGTEQVESIKVRAAKSNCDNCGAPRAGSKCSYCRTVYL